MGRKGGLNGAEDRDREPNEKSFLKLKPFSQTVLLPQMKTHRAEVKKVDCCHSGLLEARRALALIPIEK